MGRRQWWWTKTGSWKYTRTFNCDIHNLIHRAAIMADKLGLVEWTAHNNSGILLLLSGAAAYSSPATGAVPEKNYVTRGRN